MDIKINPVKTVFKLPKQLDTSSFGFDISGLDYFQKLPIVSNSSRCFYSYVTVTGRPFVTSSSCIVDHRKFAFFIPVNRTDVAEDVQFKFYLAQPLFTTTVCKICESSKTTEDCNFITCYISIRGNHLLNATLE